MNRLNTLYPNCFNPSHDIFFKEMNFKIKKTYLVSLFGAVLGHYQGVKLPKLIGERI